MKRLIRKKKDAQETPEEIRARALLELGLDRPYYDCRVVGGRVEFSLLGGDILIWPDDVKED